MLLIMTTPNLDHVPSSKDKLIYLVKVLQQRSGKTYETLRKDISHFLGREISRGIFENLFRQKPHLHTLYDPKIVLGLIHALHHQVPSKKQIAPLEATLLYIYTNNVTSIRQLSLYFDLIWISCALDLYVHYSESYWDENLDNLRSETLQEILLNLYNCWGKRTDDGSDASD